jgi:DNA-binding transcriptional LysR family regulator
MAGGRVLEVKDLRCFIAVYETRGFGRGASLLHTAQSNVSVRIQRLEYAIGAPLFERRHRSITPTAKGDLLYAHATQVLALIGELENTVRRNQVA